MRRFLRKTAAAGLAAVLALMTAGCGVKISATDESQLQSIAESLSKDVESIAESAVLGESIPADSETVPAKAEPESAAEPSPEPTDIPEPLAVHVTGIRDFAIIEGMFPDVMAGISWDDTVLEVTADTSACDFGIPGTYDLIYRIAGADGRDENVTIHMTVRHDLEQFLYGMEGAVYVPVGGNFDPMENVVCDDEIAKIEPDMSALDTTKEGEYLISYHLTGTDGVSQTAVRRVHVGDEPVSPVPGQQVQTDVGEYSTVTDLGLWRLTAYMDTPEDQGPYVGQTASGAPLVAGRTVAVSQQTCERLGLTFGDRLMVDGYVYILEDYGGSAMYNSDWLDIFVDNVEDEYSERFNRYAEVYLLR